MRQGLTKRRPRVGGVDLRQQISDLVSIHLRPLEVEERLLPGHWEGDLIKDAFNRSAVGTLMEHVSGLVFLAKIYGVTATAAVHGFGDALNRVPLEMRAKHSLTTSAAIWCAMVRSPKRPARRSTPLTRTAPSH